MAGVRSFTTLRYEKHGAVAVVALDRPEVLNAYNVAMRDDLDAAAALRLFTTGAAFALDADGLGTLAPGGPADLVVVEPDPLRAPPDEVADARVRLTLVAGERVWPA